VTIEVGETYGAWNVLSQTRTKGKFVCICTVCGTSSSLIKGSDLENGKTLMCRSCSSSTSDDSSVCRGKTSFEYNSWNAMLQRCYNKNSKDYKNYGQKGIFVCDMWKSSFEAFYMSLGPRPFPAYTLERLNYTQGYFPGNVVWASREDQTKNKSDNVNLTIDGKTQVVSDWEKHPDCTVTKFTIYKRLKRGWEPQRAVFTPSRNDGKD